MSAPLLTEFLALLAKEGGVSTSDIQGGNVTAKDTLIVIDMQYDFLPGGSFGVAEGDQVVAPIAKLIGQFQSVGATVIASRDYHPNDHCSFMPEGGPFPPHCIQGSKGAEFHPEIAAALEAGSKEVEGKKNTTHIVFKGFSKDVDSFGAVAYDEKTVDEGKRLTQNKNAPHCASCWTGSFVLKCSNIQESANAPPDVMSVLNKQTIEAVLGKAKDQAPEGRIFVTGLTLDYCVLDTTLNAVGAGYQRVHLLADCARAAHIPGFGKFGTGFLSDPKVVGEQLTAAQIPLATSDQLKFE